MGWYDYDSYYKVYKPFKPHQKYGSIVCILSLFLQDSHRLG